jgi:hypothetical protein
MPLQTSAVLQLMAPRVSHLTVISTAASALAKGGLNSASQAGGVTGCVSVGP